MTTEQLAAELDKQADTADAVVATRRATVLRESATRLLQLEADLRDARANLAAVSEMSAATIAAVEAERDAAKRRGDGLAGAVEAYIDSDDEDRSAEFDAMSAALDAYRNNERGREG